MILFDNKRYQLIRIVFSPDTVRRIGILVVWFLLSPILTNIVPLQAADTDHPVRINCHVHNNLCRQALAGTEVILDISPKPVKAMTDLKFRITLIGKQPESNPYIDLEMPGMKMGPNRIFLTPQGKDVYAGNGIIVRCPSGKRVWQATVSVPNIGTVRFVFDVVY